jgi:hypothetical protein
MAWFILALMSACFRESKLWYPIAQQFRNSQFAKVSGVQMVPERTVPFLLRKTLLDMYDINNNRK